MTTYSDYGVLWDVDGTLIDTAALHFDAWKRLAQDLGSSFSAEQFAATFGRRNPEIIREVFGEHYSASDIDRLGFQKEEYYRAAARANGLHLLPGVLELLKALHSAGFKQAIGSSAPRGNLDLLLSLLDIGQYFEAIVSMEDTSRGKPDPEVFLIGAAKIKIAPAHCLVFEDAPAGVQAAKAGGMAAIGLTFVGHHSVERLAEAGADLVVRTLEEVSVATVAQLLHI
jgi:beta-phosphoglucomutase